MKVGEICSRSVVYCTRETSCMEAAQLMRSHHVGALVVAEGINGNRSAVGVITDRDIVVEVVATGLDASVITVGDIMVGDLVTVGEEQEIFETVQTMRSKGVRRLPVVDARGGLIGIVALDDILEVLAEQLDEIVKLVARERTKEIQARKG